MVTEVARIVSNSIHKTQFWSRARLPWRLKGPSAATTDGEELGPKAFFRTSDDESDIRDSCIQFASLEYEEVEGEEDQDDEEQVDEEQEGKEQEAEGE